MYFSILPIVKKKSPNSDSLSKFLIEKEYSVVFNKKENYIFKRKKIMY